MKEYAIEEGQVDLKKLVSSNMPNEDYKNAHAALCVSCHDIFIEYKGGIILVRREDPPAKGYLWPIGGRIKKGRPTEDSLELKVKEECGLSVDNFVFLGSGRTFFATDPFGHGKGTDTINMVYFARGTGDIKLNNLHSNPTIVTPEIYKKIKKELHPYVRDFMDKAIELLNSS